MKQILENKKIQTNCSYHSSIIVVMNVITVHVAVMYTITILGILSTHLLAFVFQDIAFGLFVSLVKVPGCHGP